MRTIWKFPIDQKKFSLQLPIFSQILSVQTQNKEPVMWVLVHTTEQTHERNFISVGTGDELPDGHLSYINTFQLYDGKIVFHLFEILNN